VVIIIVVLGVSDTTARDVIKNGMDSKSVSRLQTV